MCGKYLHDGGTGATLTRETRDTLIRVTCPHHVTFMRNKGSSWGRTWQSRDIYMEERTRRSRDPCEELDGHVTHVRDMIVMEPSGGTWCLRDPHMAKRNVMVKRTLPRDMKVPCLHRKYPEGHCFFHEVMWPCDPSNMKVLMAFKQKSDLTTYPTGQAKALVFIFCIFYRYFSFSDQFYFYFSPTSHSFFFAFRLCNSFLLLLVWHYLLYFSPILCSPHIFSRASLLLLSL